MISPGDGIQSSATGGDDLIDLAESVCPFIGAGLVGIIKFFTVSLFPFLVNMGIRSFILFILNPYIASKTNILIKANFV